jgi:cobalt/nickel transport protein
MAKKYLLEIIAMIAVIGFVLAFLCTSAVLPGAEFTGSDSAGSLQIAELAGKADTDFAPLIPQYVPPSGEIESALFALQAAVGGIVLGYVFGYWSCQARSKKAE